MSCMYCMYHIKNMLGLAVNAFRNLALKREKIYAGGKDNVINV